jgi:glyoxylase-like metal-dependent hydrolase (beta-lactamase superfamily II)
MLHDTSSTAVALIDPALRKALDCIDVKPTSLFVTHHHADHAAEVHLIANKVPNLAVYAADDRVRSGIF